MRRDTSWRQVLPAVLAAVLVLLAAPPAPAAAAALAPGKPLPGAGGQAVDDLVVAEGALAGNRAGRGVDGAVVGGEALGGRDLVLDASPGVPVPPAPSAASWLVADLDTGEVLAARDPHAVRRPASTLKLLTALTTLRSIPAEAVHVGTQADADAEGTRVGIVPGGVYTADELYRALLLSSGNDAAYALADLAGGRTATLAAMNDVAEDLGALDTNATDPSGLDEPGQTSSAYDLALLGRAALAQPRVAAWVATASSTFPAGPAPEGQVRGSFPIYNQNRLLTSYDGALGVKTGYTTQARNTFVGAAERGGHRLLVTLMGSGRGVTAEGATLLDWAFAARDGLSPVGELVRERAAEVVAAAPSASVVAPPQAPPAALAADVGAGGGGLRTVLLVGGVLLLVVVVLRTRVVVRQRRRQVEAARLRRAARADQLRLAYDQAQTAARRPAAGRSSVPAPAAWGASSRVWEDGVDDDAWDRGVSS